MRLLIKIEFELLILIVRLVLSNKFVGTLENVWTNSRSHILLQKTWEKPLVVIFFSLYVYENLFFLGKSTN